MDKRLEPLAELIVEIVCREMQANSSEVESRGNLESQIADDLPSDDLSTGDGASHTQHESQRRFDRPSPT
jgi:hypothetical protein